MERGSKAEVFKNWGKLMLKYTKMETFKENDGEDK